ncbi:MAG: hypothetical protein LBR88_07340 [Zoogloeaceae bacterium]|jgi:hypothetical protein|nr:hypothetical protein [Zoogloeaceae bacterium]
MTVLIGMTLFGCEGGLTDNPNLAGEFWGYTWQSPPDAWPVIWGGAESMAAPSITAAANGPVVTHFPVEANGRVLNGHRLASWFEDFYLRTHVFPARLDLGSVVTTFSEEIFLWNAWLVPKTLNGFSALPEGVSLAAVDLPDLPATVPALKEVAWVMTVVPTGPARIDEKIVFDFEASNDPILEVVGSRVVAWAWPPNWKEGVAETLEWQTDVLQSPAGFEQRRALRIAPRRGFEAEYLIHAQARQVLDSFLSAWSDKEVVLPIYTDAAWLAAELPAGADFIPCTTARRDFSEGGRALLIPEAPDSATPLTCEAVDVVGVEPGGIHTRWPVARTWPPASRLLPARRAWLTEPPEMTRLSDRLISMRARFEVVEPCDWREDWTPAQTWQGIPVWMTPPNENKDLSIAVERLTTQLDSLFGARVRHDSAGLGFYSREQRWLLADDAGRDDFRRLLYWLRGRQRALWLPTFADDLTVTAPVGKDDDRLTVRRAGYARYGLGRPDRENIILWLADGTVLFHRILAAAENEANDTELLKLSGTFSRRIEPGEFVRISFLCLVRASSDSVSLQHHSGEHGVSEASILFRQTLTAN